MRLFGWLRKPEKGKAKTSGKQKNIQNDKDKRLKEFNKQGKK